METLSGLSAETITDLKKLRGALRLRLLDLYFKANAGHIGCSLSCIDLMICSLIAHKKDNEAFILSKGHAAAALYVCLHELGELSNEVLDTYYKNGTTLPAHPAPNRHKGIPFATGSLGHGLPIASGIAKGNKILDNGQFTYVLMSDGETNEGTTWEAAHYAVNNKLDNLIVIIDRNRLQGFGSTDEILGDSADAHKWKAIGFEVTECDGHDIEEIYQSIETFKYRQNGLPKVLIANTVKGKGVSYMENRMEWHYLPMKPQQYEQAVEEVQTKYNL
ncbi:transketolase [Pseudarcicella hirudinis]|uniref:Transketolase n=1 Tax=Pseudarcicella hirudinis TaxID=1079859 RepID=A0A1I5VGJ5_9BACT|nr:transketolase [Pseudarcicella hirudinis]SFQ06678.1 transketolase [Pseudarcicella hirudinis]